MALWNEPSATRLTAGRLWLPQLNLDLMARDWSVFATPCDFVYANLDEDYVTFVGSWVTLDTVWVCYPDDWDADLSYETLLTLRMTFMLDWTRSAGPAPDVEVRFLNGSNTAVVPDQIGTAPCTIIKRYTASNLPTGPTEETIQVSIYSGTPGGTVTVTGDRSMGDRGPDSLYYFEVGT
jgi:hypothetical protein